MPSRLPVRLPRRLPGVLAGQARILLAAAIGALVLLGGFMILRDSSLVAVDHVTVTGATGPDAGAVEAALAGAARDMTTLHVRVDALRTAVEPFPVVRDVEAHGDLPHGLRIVVHEYEPVGIIVAGDERVPVAADGTLLRGSAGRDLPLLTMRSVPAGTRIHDKRAAQAVAVLAGAPVALRAQVASVFRSTRGLAARLADGPVLYFGGPERLRSKWEAAARILADPSSKGATYLDLRLPERAAAGGLEDPTPQPAPPPLATTGATAAPAAPPATTQPSTTPTASPAPQVSTVP